MALHYLLDGYNIIKQSPSLAKLPWEEGRANLVRMIDNVSPQGSVNNELTILFDGRPGRIGTPGTIRVKVAFTGDQSADDRIKKIVTDAANKKSYVVVTDDRDIQYYVRALGAKIVTVQEFLGRTREKAAGGKEGTPESGKVIPKNVEQAINTELEQIWLGKKKSKKE